MCAALAADQGVRVIPTEFDEHERVKKAPPVQCHIVCTGFHADAPARISLMNSMAVTGYLGCLYCKMCQVRASNKRRLFMGYSEPVKIERDIASQRGKEANGACFSFPRFRGPKI